MDQLERTKREFKKHHRKAMKLKEGGKAWDREITICETLLAKCKKLYQQKLKAKYN